MQLLGRGEALYSMGFALVVHEVLTYIDFKVEPPLDEWPVYLQFYSRQNLYEQNLQKNVLL
jgi:hypothetical protein